MSFRLVSDRTVGVSILSHAWNDAMDLLAVCTEGTVAVYRPLTEDDSFVRIFSDKLHEGASIGGGLLPSFENPDLILQRQSQEEQRKQNHVDKSQISSSVNSKLSSPGSAWSPALAWSPCGRKLAIGTQKGEIRVYIVENETMIYSTSTGNAVSSLHWTSIGNDCDLLKSAEALAPLCGLDGNGGSDLLDSFTRPGTSILSTTGTSVLVSLDVSGTILISVDGLFPIVRTSLYAGVGRKSPIDGSLDGTPLSIRLSPDLRICAGMIYGDNQSVESSSTDTSSKTVLIDTRVLQIRQNEIQQCHYSLLKSKDTVRHMKDFLSQAQRVWKTADTSFAGKLSLIQSGIEKEEAERREQRTVEGFEEDLEDLDLCHNKTPSQELLSAYLTGLPSKPVLNLIDGMTQSQLARIEKNILLAIDYVYCILNTRLQVAYEHLAVTVWDLLSFSKEQKYKDLLIGKLHKSDYCAQNSNNRKEEYSGDEKEEYSDSGSSYSDSSSDSMNESDDYNSPEDDHNSPEKFEKSNSSIPEIFSSILLACSTLHNESERVLNLLEVKKSFIRSFFTCMLRILEMHSSGMGGQRGFDGIPDDEVGPFLSYLEEERPLDMKDVSRSLTSLTESVQPLLNQIDEVAAKCCNNISKKMTRISLGHEAMGKSLENMNGNMTTMHGIRPQTTTRFKWDTRSDQTLIHAFINQEGGSLGNTSSIFSRSSKGNSVINLHLHDFRRAPVEANASSPSGIGLGRLSQLSLYDDDDEPHGKDDDGDINPDTGVTDTNLCYQKKVKIKSRNPNLQFRVVEIHSNSELAIVAEIEKRVYLYIGNVDLNDSTNCDTTIYLEDLEDLAVREIPSKVREIPSKGTTRCIAPQWTLSTSEKRGVCSIVEQFNRIFIFDLNEDEED